MPTICTEHFLDGTIRGPKCKENSKISACALEQIFTEAYKLQFCSKQFSFSHSTLKPSRQDHSPCWWLWARQLNHYLHLSAAFEVVAEFWRIPAKSALRYKTWHSSWLCISVPSPDPAALGSHRFVPTASEIKRGVCSGWRSSKNSSARSHDPSLSIAKWHQLLLLPLFQIKTGLSFGSDTNSFFLPYLRFSSWSQLPCM